VYKNKFLSYIIACLLVVSMIMPVAVSHAASLDNVLQTLSASTTPSQASGSQGTDIFQKLFGFLFDKILGPILHVFDNKTTTNPSIMTPSLETQYDKQHRGIKRESYHCRPWTWW